MSRFTVVAVAPADGERVAHWVMARDAEDAEQVFFDMDDGEYEGFLIAAVLHGHATVAR